MKMTVCWDAALCNLLKIYQSFRDPACLHQQGEDGGSKNLRNVGTLLSDYKEQHPRRQSSSF
jgi:hypothetical protein